MAGMRKVAIIGDVNGSVEALTATLDWLEADIENGQLPTGLMVVQAGNLVSLDEGEAVLELVERFKRAQPTAWIQLLGDNEVQSMGDLFTSWPIRERKAWGEGLFRWWVHEWMRPSVALNTTGQNSETGRKGGGGLLVTSAGMTYAAWSKLGNPGNVKAAVASLDKDARSGGDRAALYRNGDGLLDMRAGRHLLTGWLRSGMLPGFHQVHAHCSDYDYDNDDWHDGGAGGHDAPTSRFEPYVDREARYTRLSIASQHSKMTAWSVAPGGSENRPGVLELDLM